MLLVSYAFEGGHTRAHKHTQVYTHSHTRVISRNQARAGRYTLWLTITMWLCNYIYPYKKLKLLRRLLQLYLQGFSTL